MDEKLPEKPAKIAPKTAIKKGAKNTISIGDNLASEIIPSPALVRTVEYSQAAGMDGQPVYAYKGYIKALYTDNKKDVKQLRESLITRSGSISKRYYSRDLETAFLVLKDIAQIRENQATIVFGTINLSLKAKLKINSTSDYAKTYGKRLRERNWFEPTIIVLESGSRGSKTITHAHIVTIVSEAPESSLKRLKELLKLDNPESNSAVLVESEYLYKQPYTELTEIDEDQFGALPVEEGIAHTYWLGAWREPNSNEVKRRVPVNIACCDYLSKELSTKQAGKRYGFINFGNLRGMKNKERIKWTREFNKRYKSTSKV